MIAKKDTKFFQFPWVMTQLQLWHEKDDKTSILAAKMDDITILAEKFDDTTILAEKIDDITILAEKIYDITILAEKIYDITILATPWRGLLKFLVILSFFVLIKCVLIKEKSV